MSQFVCFVKYQDYKFDIVIARQTRFVLGVDFGEIMPKIDEIFGLVFNKQLSGETHVFVVFDAERETWSVVNGQEYNLILSPLSVVVIHDKPAPLTRGQMSSGDSDVQFLRLFTKEIIDFYLAVQLIDRYFKDFDINTYREPHWAAVADILITNYPKVYDNYRFTSRSSELKDNFNKVVDFYANNYYKLNLKLEPKLQKRFDMLKIIHLLDPKKACPATSCQTIVRVAAESEIKLYVDIQRKYLFDIYLNDYIRKGRLSSPYMTHQIFIDKYLDNHQHSSR